MGGKLEPIGGGGGALFIAIGGGGGAALLVTGGGGATGLEADGGGGGGGGGGALLITGGGDVTGVFVPFGGTPISTVASALMSSIGSLNLFSMGEPQFMQTFDSLGFSYPQT